MLGPKLVKMQQEAKNNFQTSFSIAKRRKMMTRDPLEEESPKQARKKPGFSTIFEHFLMFFGEGFASHAAACTVRQKCSKKHASPAEASFFARAENPQKTSLKRHFLMKNPSKNEASRNAPKNLDFQAFSRGQDG